ncbi:MAG: hypothetical protein Q4F66_01415 [Clostridium sp.]|nr:hypothetical protein [Clostridium sp.]
MKEKILDYIGIGFIANVIGFWIGLVYLMGKLSMIGNLSEINPMGAVARALPGIALTNMIYFVVDWIKLIIVCTITIYILKKYISNMQEVKRYLIGLGIGIFSVIYLYITDAKVSNIKIMIFILVFYIGYCYIWLSSTMTYDIEKTNNMIKCINKKYKNYFSKYVGYPNPIQHNKKRNSRTINLIMLDREKVNYKEKIRIDEIKKILCEVSKWLNDSEDKVDEPSNENNYKQWYEDIIIINEQIHALNQGIYLSTEKLNEIKKAWRAKSTGIDKKMYDLGDKIIQSAVYKSINERLESMLGKVSTCILEKLYKVINNKVENYIIMGLIVTGVVYYLGTIQSTVDLYNQDEEIFTPQIVLKSGDRIPAIIINNDSSHIVYYDASDKRIKEIEKLNSSYEVDHIEYNQPKLKINESLKKCTKKELNEIEGLCKGFIEVMYPKTPTKLDAEYIKEIWDQEAYKLQGDSIKKEPKFYKPSVEVALKRATKKLFDQEGNINYEIPFSYETKIGKRNEQEYEAYITCYFYDKTNYIRLDIHKNQRKKLCIYNVEAITKFE